jgi:lysyl-tRNA synthetase class 1
MEKQKIEYYTWPDKIAGMLAASKKNVLHGMWTPSGYFHIGNARSELITPLLVRKALEDEGIKAVQNLFVDDFDDFDKIPAGLGVDKGFSQYLGLPLREVPSPFPGYDSWAEYFTADLKSALEKFGISLNVISSYDNYKSGKYDEAIKIVLDNSRKIRDLWVKITGGDKPEDWIPVMPVCEKCGRASTTVATSWDGSVLKYECSSDRNYCKACGYSGELKPGKGNVKLPWRVHWVVGWYVYGTTFEIAGKDHFTKGGSVDTCQAMLREIFKREPPLQMPGEFIQINGEKMSGSRGNSITMHDWLDIAEPELLSFMILSYQPNTVIDFDLQSNKLFLLHDRYDRAERVYFGEKSGNEKQENQLKREYALSQAKPKKGLQIDYQTAVMISQVCPNRGIDELADLLKKMQIVKKISSADKEKISRRLELAKNWAEKYAPEEMKIKLNEEPPAIELTDSEKKAVSSLADNLDKEDLQTVIYQTAKENNIEPKRFFQILYNIMINRDSGPRLGPFIIAVGIDKIRKLLEKI